MSQTRIKLNEHHSLTDSPQTIDEVEKMIPLAIRSINEDIFPKFFKNMTTRLGFVIREGGGLFEHL